MIVSKSYQNCSETEVPGYNDCPSFLFLPHRPVARRKHRIVSQPLDADNVIETASNSSVPPITSHKRKHRVVSEPLDIGNGDETFSASVPPIAGNRKQRIETAGSEILDKEEILHRVDELYALKSTLLKKEYDFYKRKIDSNLMESLNSASTRQVMTRFFEEAHDKPKASNTLRSWMSSDITVINWCPAFLKIFEHTQCA